MGDDKRIESRIAHTRAGMHTTPEYVREVQDRQRMAEKLARPDPTQPFSKVLASRDNPNEQEAGESPAQEEPPEAAAPGADDAPPAGARVKAAEKAPPARGSSAPFMGGGVRHPGAQGAGATTGNRKIIIKP